jgi:hypothetical protein
MADSRKELAAVVDECRLGLSRWDYAASHFVSSITDSGDATLFDLATPEIRKAIFEAIQQLREQGHYRVLVAHGIGEVDHTDKYRRLAKLLEDGGYLKPNEADGTHVR